MKRTHSVSARRIACLLVGLVALGALPERVAAQNEGAVQPQSNGFLFSLNDPALFAPRGQAGDDETGGVDDAGEEGEESGEGYKDESGNDPRDFRDKFMPYYRFTELRNGLQQNEWVLFGFKAWTPRFGMTYEMPIRYVDASTPASNFTGQPKPGPPLPGFGGNIGSGSVDPYQAGLGDFIFRFFYRPEALEWETPCTWGPRKGQNLGGAIMPIIETTVPTNTDDLLGSDKWILSPGFAIVTDTPTFGFIAGMFFYDFSTLRDSDEIYTSRFRARIFWLQPFGKPGPGLLDGLYMMPEFQPIYDLREGRFSLWIGPEFGKIIKMEEGSKIDSVSIYAKPGWGWAKSAVGGDREFSMEVGVRVAF